MPIPVEPHIMYRAEGAMAGDSYSFGMALLLPSTISHTPFNLGGIATAMQGFTDTFWGATNGLKALNTMAVSAPVVTIRYYENGALLGSSTSGTGETPSLVATGSPAYTALVVTLLTNNTTRSGRGRFYLPTTVAPIDGANLQWTKAGIDNLAVPLTAFIQKFGNTPFGLESVLAKVSVRSLKTGTLNVVQSVRVNSIPDTQHGRENKFKPFYTKTFDPLGP